MHKDLHYMDSKHNDNTLDVLIPENIDESQRLPVIMHVHGGGWQRGNLIILIKTILVMK